MGEKTRPVARRHHTVPRFYLDGFALSGQVLTIRLPGERRFLQSVNDATVSKDFYAVEGHEDGEDVIEKGLAEVEGAVAAVVSRVKAGTWPLPLEDRMALGHYIALQATRVPAQRRNMDYISRQLLRLQIGARGKSDLRRQLERYEGAVSDERVERLWKQATHPDGPPIKTPKIESIRQMLELSDEIARYVVGRPWTLIRFHRRSLITSDSPVGLVADPEEDSWRGVGFATAWGLTFPLTRKLGLLMSSIEPLVQLKVPVEHVHRGRADASQAGTTVLEKFLNAHTAMNASEWLFHHPDDERFVPAELPEPSPVSMQASSQSYEFYGASWFGSSQDD